MEKIKPGERIEKHITVKKSHLANEVGSGDVAVFSTPMVINAMEAASSELLRNHLEPEFTSVGTKINIDHVAPTLEGVKVKVASELVNIDRRKYYFYVEVSDNAGIIAKGEHVRVVVEKEIFIKKAKERSEINSVI